MGSHRDKAQSKKKDKEAPEPALPETAALKRWLKSSSGAGSQDRKFQKTKEKTISRVTGYTEVRKGKERDFQLPSPSGRGEKGFRGAWKLHAAEGK